MPDREEFKSIEVAFLLGGITQQSVGQMVRRYQLPSTGNTRSKLFPRATVETLRAKYQGKAIGTTNDWLQAIRQFARWMIPNRITQDPFVRLKPGNVKLDTRRRRGELSPEELTALLTVATASQNPFRDLSGRDRAMLYRVAVGTGFRTSELAALIPDYFDLTGTRPVVILPAEHSKNRKGANQPIGAILAADLKKYLSDRPAKEPAWPGAWSKRSADMIRLDLAAAGVPVEVDGPEGTETRDFHALRACFISNVIRAGADLKEAMTLARHSDPKLTVSRYARTRLNDLGAVVDKLPETTGQPPAQSPQVNVLRMTGTDSGCTPDVPRDVPASGYGRGRAGAMDENETEEPTQDGG